MDPRGASCLSRVGMVRCLRMTVRLLSMPGFAGVLEAGRYGEVKGLEMLAARRKVKADVKELALKGWVPNVIDDFCLDSV